MTYTEYEKCRENEIKIRFIYKINVIKRLWKEKKKKLNQNDLDDYEWGMWTRIVGRISRRLIVFGSVVEWRIEWIEKAVKVRRERENAIAFETEFLINL